MDTPVLAVRHVSKSFAGVRALVDIDLEIAPGEIHCLAGENGSGKSTLIKVISGVHRPDSGSIAIEGQEVTALTPLSAMKAGIQVIYQDFSLFSNLTVAENIMMTASVTDKKSLYSRSRTTRHARTIVERLGVALPLDADVEQLSVADKQLVAISRALIGDARLIIMDEPTSALDYGNTVRVLSTVRQLAREGMSIVQSTHQPDQAFLYADQTLVINDGRVHAFGNPKDVITKELVSTIYDVDVEVNSLYGDKVRVCVPVREIER